MATITSLSFLINSRYDGDGVRRARSDIDGFNRSVNHSSSFVNSWSGRMIIAAKAATVFGPALAPISGYLTSIAGAATAMSTSVVAALGVYGAATQGAIARALELDKAHDKANKAQAEYVKSVKGMSKAWQDFITATQNQTLATSTNVVQGLTAGIGLLKPVVDALHPSILRVSQDFENWMKGSSAKNYINLIKASAVPALNNLIAAGKDVINVLGDGFRAFLPNGVQLSKTLRDGAAAMREWSDGGGFQRFLESTRKNAPMVREFFSALKGAIGTILAVMRELGPLSLGIATTLLKLVAALPPEWIANIVRGFLAWKLAIMGMMVIKTLISVFTALRSAWFLLNIAFASTPIGAIITAVVALIAAIVLIATKTTWFQTAWKYTWNFIKEVFSTVYNFLTNGLGQLVLLILGPVGALLILLNNWSTVWNAIKMVAEIVWNALKTAWNAVVNALITAWNAVSGALVAAWNAVWNALKVAGEFVWNAIKAAWNAVVTAFTTAWTTVSSALVTAWNAVWNAIKTAAEFVWNALQVAWNAFINGLQAIWTAVSGALSAAWNAVWNAIKAAAEFVWNALKTAWDAFINGLQAIWNTVSGALSAAWNAVWNAIKTAGEAIWNALKAAWQAFLTAVQTVWTTVSGALSAAWNAVWNAIKTAAQAVWTALQTAWNAFLTVVRTVYNTFAAAITGSWNLFWNAIKTVAQFIWNALQTAWQTFTNTIRNIYNTFAGALKASWDLFWNAIKNFVLGIWNWLKDKWEATIKWIKEKWDYWSKVIALAWDKGWKVVRDSFKKIWDSIKDIAEKAINWLLKPINMLIKGFNNIASALKINVKIPEIKVNFANGGMVGGAPEFAAGGVVNFARGGSVPGYAPGKDRVPAMLSPGEGVLVPEAVRGLGGSNFVHGANHYYSKGRAPRRGSNWNPKSEGFADGGMVGGGSVQGFAVGGLVSAALARAGVSTGLVSQGEYSDGSLSAGTHLGGGVVDLSTTSSSVLARLRAAGFAAWARGPENGMSPHIHAVLMSHPDLSSAARAQVASFKAGGSGLGVGGGGGGGGGFDPVEMIKSIFGATVGEVLRKIAQFGGSLADFVIGGGGGDKKEDDGGGFWDSLKDTATDLVNPFNDDNPVVDKAAEVAKNIAGPMLGMFLGAIDRSAVKFAFDFIGWGDAPDGAFGDIVQEMGKKALNGVIDFITNDAAERAPDMSAMGGGGGGDVNQWAFLAATALKMGGLSGSQLPKFLALMKAESGGNPMAINTWDSNALKGQASRGLMQVIPSTFAAYHVPGTSNNIFDPLANMAASAAYIKARYGGNVPGSPYADGTTNATAGMHLVGEKGPELVTGPGMAAFGGGETVLNAADTASVMSGGGGGDEGAVPAVEEITSAALEMQAMLTEVWDAVTAKSKASWTALTTEVFTPMTTQLATTVPASLTAMMTSWTTTMTTMVTTATAQWTALVASVFTPMQDILTIQVPAWTLLMQTAVLTSWTAITQGMTVMWQQLQTTVYLPMQDVMTVQVPGWSTQMQTSVLAAWAAISEGTTSTWNQVQTTITDAITAIVGPINQLLEGFNNVSSALGLDVTVPTIALAKGGVLNMRHGGSLTGYSPGRDSVPAMLSPGEGVLTPEAVRGLGGAGFVHSANRTFAGHRGAGKGAKKLKRGDAPHFAQGGMVGVQHFAVGGMTAAALAAAGVSLGLVSQGEYSTGVAASAGTHDGGGVVDLATTSPAILAALHAAGFAAWIRGNGDGMSPHIHAVLMNHPDLSPQAAAQVLSFLAGGSGLGVGSVAGGIAIPLFDPAEALGKIVAGEDSGIPAGMEKMLLGMLTRETIEGAFSGIKSDLDGADVGDAMFGQMLHAMGDQLYGGVIEFITAAAEEAKASMAALAVAGSQSVQAWAGLAAQALAIAGLDPGQLGAFLALMEAESGGDPNSINTYDINAQNGVPSQGLMQVIPPTFATYRDPSLPNNILDPLANMVASARYILAVYGGQVPGSPYAAGTNNATAGWHMVGERGPELMWMQGHEKVRSYARSTRMMRGSGGDHGSCGGANITINFNGPTTEEAVRRAETSLAPKLRSMMQQGVGHHMGG